jgi:hypothetical protein
MMERRTDGGDVRYKRYKKYNKKNTQRDGCNPHPSPIRGRTFARRIHQPCRIFAPPPAPRAAISDYSPVKIYILETPTVRLNLQHPPPHPRGKAIKLTLCKDLKFAERKPYYFFRFPLSDPPVNYSSLNQTKFKPKRRSAESKNG